MVLSQTKTKGGYEGMDKRSCFLGDAKIYCTKNNPGRADFANEGYFSCKFIGQFFNLSVYGLSGFLHL